jgi:hypothetical protein
MGSKPNTTRAKRPSKGLRTHVRRLKQEAGLAGEAYKPTNPVFTPAVKKV